MGNGGLGGDTGGFWAEVRLVTIPIAIGNESIRMYELRIETNLLIREIRMNTIPIAIGSETCEMFF